MHLHHLRTNLFLKVGVGCFRDNQHLFDPLYLGLVLALQRGRSVLQISLFLLQLGLQPGKMTEKEVDEEMGIGVSESVSE